MDRVGHRTDIKTVALSSDDQILLSGGTGDDLKIWSLKNGQCIRSLPNPDEFTATCSAFLPGDRFAIVGTKCGKLVLYDCWSSTLMNTTEAHNG